MDLSDIVSFLLDEASDAKIAFLAKRYNVHPEEVRELANIDPTGTYLEWLTKQYVAGNFGIEEDEYKLKDYFIRYSRLKNSPRIPTEYKDINRFATPGDLAQWLAANEEQTKSKGQITREREVSGAKVLYTQSPYELIQVQTPEAGAKLFKGTEWCVADPRAFNQYGPPFVMVTKHGDPYVLIHPRSGSAKDVWDNSITPKLGRELSFVADQVNLYFDDETAYLFSPERLVKSIEAGKVVDEYAVTKYVRDMMDGERWYDLEKHLLRKVTAGKTDLTLLLNYAIAVEEEVWDELPEMLLEEAEAGNAHNAIMYAELVLRRRWPELEAVIVDDYDSGWAYLRKVMHTRWPAFEKTLLHRAAVIIRDNANYLLVHQAARSLCNYAVMYIKDRWPEAEKYIMKAPEVANVYAQDVIQGRWPEAEESIAKSMNASRLYAKNVIKGRFPAGEAAIKTHEESWKQYIRDVKHFEDQARWRQERGQDES